MTLQEIEDALRRAGVDSTARVEAAVALVTKRAEEAAAREARREADATTPEDARALVAEMRTDGLI